MTYDEAVAYLGSFVNYEHANRPEAMREITLERMRRLCERIGQPQRSFRSVLVSGTNGKGSICAMLYAMLRVGSLRVGLYTSPHLEHLRERIRIWPAANGQTAQGYADDWISEPEFAATMEELRPVLEAMRAESPEQAPTYFEVLTALAFLHFSQRGVEIAVLEVGLGGRLDATNVVEQAVSVLAPIDMDHSEVLGSTLADIAREKAGIIKPGQTVITTPQAQPAMETLRESCQAQGAPLVVCGQDLTMALQVHSFHGLQVSFTAQRGIYEFVSIPVLGRHQAQNAAVAIGALEALADTGIPYSLVERGLARLEWPGRLEVVHDAPLVILDGAHNVHAAQVLRGTLEELRDDRRIHLMIGMSSDKSVEPFGECLGPLAETLTCVQSRHPRALHAAVLADRLAPYCNLVQVIPEPEDAYTYLLNTCRSSDLIVVTGSLFLVGELRAILRKASLRPRRRRRRARTVSRLP